MASGSDGEASIEGNKLCFDSLTRKTTNRHQITRKQPPPPPLPTLSFDCVAEILSRLPLKLVLQLRYQAKFFNSLFSNLTFTKQHFRYSTKRYRLIVSSTNCKGNLILFDSPIQDSWPSKIGHTRTQITTYPNSFEVGYWASSSCDGILCLTMCKASPAILWNPTLRTFKILPPIFDTNNNNKRPLSAYSFGYDPFIHNYKVVAMSFSKDKCQVRVLTLGTMDSWRRIQDFPYSGIYFGLGIFVGGTVNWSPLDNASSLRLIVSLDLKKESYQKIPQPGLKNDGWTLGELKDCLCIYATSSYNMFLDVWIMKEYGNKASWTKLYCVPHMGKWGLCDYTKTFYISNNDQLLLTFDEPGKFKSKLVVYDSKNGTFIIPEVQNLSGRMATQVYVESLISPCSEC